MLIREKEVINPLDRASKGPNKALGRCSGDKAAQTATLKSSKSRTEEQCKASHPAQAQAPRAGVCRKPSPPIRMHCQPLALADIAVLPLTWPEHGQITCCWACPVNLCSVSLSLLTKDILPPVHLHPPAGGSRRDHEPGASPQHLSHGASLTCAQAEGQQAAPSPDPTERDCRLLHRIIEPQNHTMVWIGRDL